LNMSLKLAWFEDLIHDSSTILLTETMLLSRQNVFKLERLSIRHARDQAKVNEDWERLILRISASCFFRYWVISLKQKWRFDWKRQVESLHSYVAMLPTDRSAISTDQWPSFSSIYYFSWINHFVSPISWALSHWWGQLKEHRQR
jgi:hypothetical protein